MFHLQNAAAFLILSACICQTEANGQRATSDTGKVTLQPWLVGLTAVVVFLFIVFAMLIIKRLFFKKNTDELEEMEQNLTSYENRGVDLELIEETKLTNF